MKHLIILLMLVLGCLKAGPSTEEVILSTEGIRVITFEPDKAEIQSGERVGLLMQVQNVGGSHADDLEIRVKRSGKLDVKPISDNSISRILPPNERTNVPGETFEAYWEITAPQIDFPQSWEIVAEVSYNYTTTAMKEISVLTVERLNELRESVAEPKVASTKSSLGPVSLEIQTAEPVQVDQTCKKTFPFDIILSNTAQGSVISEGESLCTTKVNCIDSVTVTLQSDESDTIKCKEPTGEFTEAGKTSTINGILLWKGQNARVNCQISVDLTYNDATKSCEEIERYPVIIAEAGYRYLVDKSLVLEVRP